MDFGIVQYVAFVKVIQRGTSYQFLLPPELPKMHSLVNDGGIFMLKVTITVNYLIRELF